MKVKTSELSGTALDWAVAKCEGAYIRVVCGILYAEGDNYQPSTDWSQGGPIAEREWINLTNQNDIWTAEIADDVPDGYHAATACTPLVAAMRVFVLHHLGDEVDVPNEIL